MDSSTDFQTILLSKAKLTQKQKKKLRGDLTPFISKSFQIWDHFFPLPFPKESESLKMLDIQLQEVGAKTHLNGTSKVNRRTDGHTDRHFDL